MVYVTVLGAVLWISGAAVRRKQWANPCQRGVPRKSARAMMNAATQTQLQDQSAH